MVALTWSDAAHVASCWPGNCGAECQSRTLQECARYLETFKAYESKPADLIQGRADEDYLSRLNAAITTVSPHMSQRLAFLACLRI